MNTVQGVLSQRRGMYISYFSSLIPFGICPCYLGNLNFDEGYTLLHVGQTSLFGLSVASSCSCCQSQAWFHIQQLITVNLWSSLFKQGESVVERPGCRRIVPGVSLSSGWCLLTSRRSDSQWSVSSAILWVIAYSPTPVLYIFTLEYVFYNIGDEVNQKRNFKGYLCRSF